MKILTLCVSLKGSEPLIWRRFQISDEMTLARLHGVIQITMGWENCHMHQFFKGKVRYSRPDPNDGLWGDPSVDESKTAIGDVLARKRQKLEYEYDFGDGWMHDIVVEDVCTPEPGRDYPVCLEGENACPPEDCGGLWGYYNKLKIMADPKHEYHKEIVEWMGAGFDPKRFDLDRVNRVLANLGKRASG